VSDLGRSVVFDKLLDKDGIYQSAIL